MIRGLSVVALTFTYILVVGTPLLIYTIISGNTDRIYRVGVSGARLALWMAGVRLEVSGREKIPRERAVVYVMNHQSNCDPPAAVSILPPVLILAKKEFFRVPVLGKAMRLRGFIPVDRKSREQAVEAVGQALQSLKRGHSFLAFAEGTRSVDGRLLPFKKGVFRMAIQAGVPVVPISISGSRHVMPKGKLAMRRGAVRITIHNAIETTGLRSGDVVALQARVRAAISSGLAEEEQPVAGPAML